MRTFCGLTRGLLRKKVVGLSTGLPEEIAGFCGLGCGFPRNGITGFPQEFVGEPVNFRGLVVGSRVICGLSVGEPTVRFVGLPRKNCGLAHTGYTGFFLGFPEKYVGFDGDLKYLILENVR